MAVAVVKMIEKGSMIAVKGTFWRVDDIKIKSGEIVLKVTDANGRRSGLRR